MPLSAHNRAFGHHRCCHDDFDGLSTYPCARAMPGRAAQLRRQMAAISNAFTRAIAAALDALVLLYKLLSI